MEEQKQSTNNPSVISSNTLVKPLSQKPNPLMVILGGLILLLLIATGVLVYQNMQLQKMISQKQISTSASPIATSDPTANWKTYTNDLFGFTLKYPAEWILVDNHISSDVFSSATVVAFNSPKNIYQSEPTIIGSFQVGLLKKSKYSIQEQIGSLGQGLGSSSITQNERIINNIKGTMLGLKDTVGGLDRNIFFFEKGDFIYSLFANWKVGDTENNKIVDQILSTFKFLDQTQTTDTSNWKMYTNKDNGFSFKYPSDINLEENVEAVSLDKWGPTQKAQTEFYDGIGLHFFVKTLENQTLEQWVDQAISQSNGVVSVSEGKNKISLNGYSGFTYTIAGLGTQRNIILQSPFSRTDFIQIINSTNDPTNKGFENVADQIISTFKFTN